MKHGQIVLHCNLMPNNVVALPQCIQLSKREELPVRASGASLARSWQIGAKI